MAYTEELKQLIQIVEKTRPERVARKKAGEDFPPMSLEERDAIGECRNACFLRCQA